MSQGRAPENHGREPARRGSRRALLSLLLYALVFGGDRVAYLVTLPFVTRSVTIGDFARFALILVSFPVARLLCGLGTSSATIRYYGMTSDERERERLPATLFWSRVVSAGALAAAVAACAGPISRAWLRGDARIVELAAAALFGLAVGEAVLGALRARQLHRRAALALAAGSVAEFAAIVLLVLVRRLGLLGLVAAELACDATTLGVALVCVGRAVWRRPAWRSYRRLVAFGVPLAASYFVAAVGGLDRYLVGALSSLSAVAAYQIAAMPVAAVVLVEHAVVVAYEPYVYDARREGALSEGTLPGLVGALALILSWCGLLPCLLGPELFHVLGPPGYASAIGAAPWLAFAAVSEALLRVVGIGGGLAARTRPWALASLVELALAVSLMVLVTPVAGIAGAAAMRFVAAFAGMLLSYALSRGMHPLRLPMLKVAAYIVLCVATSATLVTFPTPLWTRIGALAVVGALGLPLFGLSLRSLRNALKQTA